VPGHAAIRGVKRCELSVINSNRNPSGVAVASQTLNATNNVLDPSTFEPVVSFMTRYGYVELSNTASSLGNAADYLGRVGITSANVKFS
jgi:hypothetical protein